LFQYSQSGSIPSLGTNYVGDWINNATLVIKITDSTGAAPPSVGTFAIQVNASAGLKNEAASSLSSSSASPLLTGTFSAAAGPTISLLTVVDPDGADAVYGDGDKFTIKFLEKTNRPDPTPTVSSLSKSDLDTLLDYKEGGVDVIIGTLYSGVWLDPSTLVITITDSTGHDSITIGGFTISVDGTAELKNAEGTSLSSTATSPTLGGSFGDKLGPSITSLVADDPDNSDSIFSNGDTMTVKFSEATNEPDPTSGVDGLSQSDLNSIFTFSQSIGDGFSGVWETPSRLVITIDDATTDSPPEIDELILVVKSSAGLRDSAEGSLVSTAESPALSGSFGTFIEIIDVGDGGTASSTLPSGIITSIELPSGESTSLTIERTEIDESSEDSAIIGILGTVVEITPEDETVCSEVNPCLIEFTFTRDDAEALGLDPFDVEILHDINDNGVFEDGEVLDTTITQLDENTFKASASLDSFSKFAVGGVKALALAALLGGSGQLGNYPSFGSFSITSLGDPSKGLGAIIREIDLYKLTETQVLTVGETLVFNIDLYENQGITNIEHVSFLFNNIGVDEVIKNNFRGIDKIQQKYDPSIVFERFGAQEITITDPNGLFASAKFKILVRDATNFVLQFIITFAKPMDTANIFLQVWDSDKNPIYKEFPNALKIIDPELVPSWIKTNAEWWSNGQISDFEFIQGIQHLINNNIISVTATVIEEDSSKEIPNWIRNNADWWSTGSISDADFLNGLEYLVNHGIIKV